MEQADLGLRRRTYAFFVEHGRAPVAAEMGDPKDVVDGWRRLHEEHALVLNEATHELRMGRPHRTGLGRHTGEQNQAILERLGLTGEVWRLA